MMRNPISAGHFVPSLRVPFPRLKQFINAPAAWRT